MSERQLFSDTFFAMGTCCDVVFTGLEKDFAEQMFFRIKKEIVHLEHILSCYLPDSPASELNRAGKNKWLVVPDELWNVIALCFDYFQISNGAFDITSGPIIKLWKEKSGGSSEVSDKEIKKVMDKSGFQKVELDFERRRVRFNADEMEFDFGAIGKGVALDTIQPILEKNGVKNGIVSFGESSILALGKHPNGEYWPLGIRSTFQPNEYVHVFSTCNECVTTSGTTVNIDDGKGKWRNHIVSPVVGRPVTENKLVSAKTQSACLGEFITTTWLILPDEDKNILSDQLKDIEILEAEYIDGEDFKTKLTIV